MGGSAVNLSEMSVFVWADDLLCEIRNPFRIALFPSLPKWRCNKRNANLH